MFGRLGLDEPIVDVGKRESRIDVELYMDFERSIAVAWEIEMCACCLAPYNGIPNHILPTQAYIPHQRTITTALNEYSAQTRLVNFPTESFARFRE